MLATLTGWVLGMLLGMRHALEPDHLTAVSTLMAEAPSARRGAALGALWGIGHSLSLLVVGLVLAALHAKMPARLADAFELSVALMLVGLGGRAIGRALHAHAGHAHTASVACRHCAFARRSLVVGIIHGLAGSGALTAFVLADLPTAAARVTYMILFGLGSIAGMALLSGLAGWPLARIGRSQAAARGLAGITGAISAALGLAWGWGPASRLLG